MQVTLIGKDYINKLVLPQNIAGNYWISETIENKEMKLVSIEAREGIWFVSSKQYAKIFELKEIAKNFQWVKIEDSIALKEHQVLGVQLGESKEMFLLYYSPVLEKFTHLKIKDKKSDIFIGSGKDNQITYYNPWTSETHAKLYDLDGKWMLENYDKDYGIFVNGKVRHKNAKALVNGDVVWIMGLKIIMLGDSIYINNPNEQCYLDSNVFEVIDEEPLNANIIEDKKDEEEDEYFSRAPRLTDIIETENLKISAPPQAPDEEEMPMILMLGSSLTMGLVMMMSLVRTIDGGVNGRRY